jgi:hypothetical protein
MNQHFISNNSKKIVELKGIVIGERAERDFFIFHSFVRYAMHEITHFMFINIFHSNYRHHHHDHGLFSESGIREINFSLFFIAMKS